MLSCPHPDEAQIWGRKTLDMHPGSIKSEDSIRVEHSASLTDEESRITVHRRYRLSSDGSPIEEELCVRDDIIVLTEGKANIHRTIKTFTLTEGPNQVLWTRYVTNDIKSRAILKIVSNDPIDFKHIDCISSLNIKSKLLTTYTNGGEEYITHIPFEVHKMWPTTLGLLIERPLQRGNKAPRIFSLFHPLSELAPVNVFSTNQRKLINHDGIVVCFSSDDSEYVVIFNTRELMHSICKLRLANTAELQGSRKTKDLSISMIQSPAFMSSTPVVSPANQSTPVLTYPLRSRLSDTLKSRSIRSPNLLRVQRSTPTLSTPMRTPARGSFLALPNTTDPLAQSFSTPLNKTITSSSMLSRLNANITVISDPVLPDFTLDIVYTDKVVIPSPTDKVRIVEDLLGNRYLVYLLKSAKRIRVLKICHDAFIVAGEITGYDFEYMDSLKMMLVMTTTEGHLFLYSGITMLCSVKGGPVSPAQLSQPSTTRRSRVSEPSEFLRSPTNLAFTLRSAGANVVYVYDNRDSKEYVLRFPLPNYCETVNSCVKALEHMLEPEMVMLIKYKWYLQKSWISKTCRSTTEELQSFLKLLLLLIGFDQGDGSPTKNKRLKPEIDEDDDWEFLQNFQNIRLSPGSLKFSSSTLSSVCYHVLFTLHIVYEELKMNSVLENHCKLLADFLCRLSASLSLANYRNHYVVDFPELDSVKVSKTVDKLLRELHVPDFFDEKPPCFRTYVQTALAGNSSGLVFPCIAGVTTNIQSTIQIFGTLIEGGGMAYQHLLSTRTWSSRPEQLEEVLSSSDVAKMNSRLAYRFMFSCLIQKLVYRCSHEFNADLYSLLGRGDLGKQVKMRKSTKNNWLIPFLADSTKGGEGFENLFHGMLSLRFGEDYRIKEVCSMLTTSVPVIVNVKQAAEMNDHDYAEEQEKRLYSLCVRTLALPTGRGMLTLYTVHPTISEPIPIADCEITGRAPPKNNILELKTIETPPNMVKWPYFHNGAAAGLRVARSARNVTSPWIALNQQSQEGNNGMIEFGGFMLGLGLGGHLASLNPVFICDLLQKRNAFLCVGVLLGLGASKKGTMCQDATNLIAIHIDALLPSTSTELDVSSECRVAAISALGLLYIGSGHYHMCDILLSEIGRPPGPEMEHSVDRESHSLSAGIALGMVMLCRGADASQAIQTKVRNTLYNYMVGGPTQSNLNKCYRSPSYQIREGDHINISVTSPGATLALGLIYHRTENRNVASLMNVPETQYLLDTVQPDYLLLRTLSKALIMWSTVSPSKQWVESHLTKFILENAFKRPNEELSGALDYEGATQAYCNVISGACFALGLKFAGSADQAAFKTLRHYTMMFYEIQKKPAADQAGKNTIETSLLVCLLSTSLVMAGTGDLEILRLCRVLRKRIGQGLNCVFYGSHMMIHMAMGFLFLGGGSLTLSTKPEAIAVLVCALYPKFPTHFSDNRYHLQALRHLYVLAVEPRMFVCQDVVSSKLVKAKLSVKLKSSEVVEMTAPCNLPQLDTVESIVIDDERYWRVVFNEKNRELLEEVLNSRSLIYVKQKAGMMSYVDDPNGYKTALAQCHMKEALRGRNVENKLEHLESFSNTPLVSKFVENMLLPKGVRDSVQERLCTIVMECAAAEQLEFLSILTDLLSLRVKASCTYNLQQFKLISEFMSYASQHQLSICGEEIVREVLKEVESRVTSPNESELWFGGIAESAMPKSLPALFKMLKDTDMSTTAIVKLYNSSVGNK